MKRPALLLSSFLLILSNAIAQEQSLIKVKANTDPRKTLSVGERYRFPQFRDGRVYFADGRVSGTRLNYNVLLGEMHFIDPKGDTLALTNEQAIKGVMVDKTTFYYELGKGFVEVIADYNTVKLALHQKLLPISSEKIGGYGQSSGTSAIGQVRTVPNHNGQMIKLEGSGDYILKPERTYYLIDQNARIQPATKAGILKVFGRNKKEIDAYLKTENIDLRNETDLHKLLQFCRDLPV